MALSLEIVTPDGIVWHNNNVDSVVLPASNGEIEILSGHVPLITILEAGAVGVKYSGKEENIAIDKGYARIMGDVVSVLTEASINVETLNINDIEKAKQDALKAVEEGKKNKISEEELERLQSVARFTIAQMLAKAKRKS